MYTVIRSGVSQRFVRPVEASSGAVVSIIRFVRDLRWGARSLEVRNSDIRWELRLAAAVPSFVTFANRTRMSRFDRGTHSQ